MATQEIRIKAVEGRMHSLVDTETGKVLVGRRAGCDKRGAPLAEGELVPDCSHHRRAIARGDIVLVEEASR